MTKYYKHKEHGGVYKKEDDKNYLTYYTVDRIKYNSIREYISGYKVDKMVEISKEEFIELAYNEICKEYDKVIKEYENKKLEFKRELENE